MPRVLRGRRSARLGLERGRDPALRATTVQGLYALGAVGLGVLVPHISVGTTVPAGRTIEALVATAVGVITFIGIVYSLLFIVVQFGATTFTPRLNLFRDARIVWHSFGFFLSILVFAFTAAFSIGQQDEVTALVPITLVGLLLAALALFRQLQDRAFRSIQLASTLEQVTDRGRDVIDRLYGGAGAAVRPSAPEDPEAPSESAGTVVAWTRPSAVLQVIDVLPLVGVAHGAGARIDFRVRPGDTLAEGDTLAVVNPLERDPGDVAVLETELLAAAHTGYERTFEQDPLLALRVLVDIALRALSPAVHDPTTAAQAVDALDGLLRPLLARELAVGRVRDTDGIVRVRVPMPLWEEFVAVALDELVPLSPTSIQLRRRLRRLLEDLIDRAPPDRRGALESRLVRLPPEAGD